MSDSSSSPPGHGSPSPPSPDSGSSPTNNNANGSPPSPSSNSSPSPPSKSNPSPPSSNASPSPPDSSSSPPKADSSSSPPPPKSNSNSPPPPDGSTPPSHIVSPPPPSGSSPSFDNIPLPPDFDIQPPSDNSESPSDSSTPVFTKMPPTPKDSLPNERSSSESTKNSPSRQSPSSYEDSSDSGRSDRNGEDSSDSGRSDRNGSDSGGSTHGNGIIIGFAIVGVVVVLIAICFVSTKRRRRRRILDALDYGPPNSISIRSDGNYYRQTQTLGGAHPTDSYHGASGVTAGSNGYGYHSGPQEAAGHAGSKSLFSYEELMDVTNGFLHENIVGEGGFGYVYKGTLSDGRRVAVKQLKAGSGQGEREFHAEVDIISRVHHRHLVSLVGYCIAEYHRLLVYEFLPNNTLEHHLHGKGLPPLEWSKRVQIAIGSAKGLAYLHEDCHPRIIHRDIKSANILLEDSFEPQVADFGLAKLSNDAHTHVSTRVMGTFGYLAPEYASSGKLTDRSDVFSFGVVLLELITGRKPVDSARPYGDESLVEWARPLLVRALETGECVGLVDPKLENNYSKTEMLNMIEAAAACVRHSGPKRPRMVQVVRALDSQEDTPGLTNCLKYGQTQVFNQGQNSADIQKIRQMAFGNDTDSLEYDSGEYDRRTEASSGEFRSREHKPPPQTPPNYESDTRPMFQAERSTNGGRGFL